MGIRDFTYYNWQNIYSTPISGVLHDITQDVSGNIYAVGAVASLTTEIPYWYIIRTTNSGSTWDVLFSGSLSGSAYKLAIHPNGSMVAVGIIKSIAGGAVEGFLTKSCWAVLTSTISNPTVWTAVDIINSSSLSTSFFPTSVDFGNTNVYVAGYNHNTNGSTGMVRRAAISSLGTWTSVLHSSTIGTGVVTGLKFYDVKTRVVGGSEQVFVTGRRLRNGSSTNWDLTIHSSSDQGSNWASVFSASTLSQMCYGSRLAVSPENDIYCLGSVSESSPQNYTKGLFSASFAQNPKPGALSHWGVLTTRDDIGNFYKSTDSDIIHGDLFILSGATDEESVMYSVGNGDYNAQQTSFDTKGNIWWVKRSRSMPITGVIPAQTPVLAPIMRYPGTLYVSGSQTMISESYGTGIFVRRENGREAIYTVGGIQERNGIYGSGYGLVRKGVNAANSESIGPMTLKTSYPYVKSEMLGYTEIFNNLANINEFPHSMGAYQMRNTIVGTTDSGKVGRDDNSIVQIKHKGSFVKVLWPRQDSDSFVRGYGDFSQGQKSGKLTTAFSPGDFIDVTQYDHMTLYGYLKKVASGTMDDIVIRVERRPLRDLPFAPEQAVVLEESGSYATEAILKDLVYRKDVDYGDLSISEIGFPIDIPLENTRELRISCRHKTGQELDENKNFIVWGRLIKSDEET